MSESECRTEEEQVRAIPQVKVGDIGFVCIGGFDFESTRYRLVDGDDLYGLQL